MADSNKPPAAVPPMSSAAFIAGGVLPISLEVLQQKPMRDWSDGELANWFEQVAGGAFKAKAACFAGLSGMLFAPFTEAQIKEEVKGSFGSALFNTKKEWLEKQAMSSPPVVQPSAVQDAASLSTPRHRGAPQLPITPVRQSPFVTITSPIADLSSLNTSVPTNKVPPAKWWADNVREISLKGATEATTSSKTHMRFMHELLLASTQPKQTLERLSFPLSVAVNQLQVQLQSEIAQLRADEKVFGVKEECWKDDVAKPLFKNLLRSEFRCQPEDSIYIVHHRTCFVADMAVAQRKADSDENSIVFDQLQREWGSALERSSICVAPWLQVEVKRSNVNRDRHKRKLAMQVLLAMEQQETFLKRLLRKPCKEETTALQFPWAVGVLTDNAGVTFMYMSAPNSETGMRDCITQTCEWDHLDRIFACIAVLREFAHLFWDELMHAVQRRYNFNTTLQRKSRLTLHNSPADPVAVSARRAASDRDAAFKLEALSWQGRLRPRTVKASASEALADEQRAMQEVSDP